MVISASPIVHSHLSLVSYSPNHLESIQIFNRNFRINKQTKSVTFSLNSAQTERQREGKKEVERERVVTIGTISNYIKLSAHTYTH